MAVLSLGFGKQRICRGREKAHTKEHCQDQYVPSGQFRERNENNTVLDWDRPNDLECHVKVFGTYPLEVEFPDGLEHTDDRKRSKIGMLIGFIDLRIFVCFL